MQFLSNSSENSSTVCSDNYEKFVFCKMFKWICTRANINEYFSKLSEYPMT